VRLLRLTISISVGLMACNPAILRAQPSGRGVVTGPAGEPLSNVWVQELGAWSGTVTKADGVFGFPLGRKLTLLFAREGSGPEIRMVAGTEPELSQIMLPLSDTPASLSPCRDRGQGLLIEIDLAKVPSLVVKRGGDVDFFGYTATYTAKGATAILSSMTGMHIAGLTPTPDWVKGISSFTVQSLKCGSVQWIDLRGVSGAGFESRWIGFPQGFLEYSNVPSEAARTFDHAIGGACWMSVR
jgi:hypothetical protein